MGSATTQALATTTAELTAANVGDLTVARELFAAAREIADSAQLSGALSSWGAPARRAPRSPHRLRRLPAPRCSCSLGG
jgi:hypothetical protein